MSNDQIVPDITQANSPDMRQIEQYNPQIQIISPKEYKIEEEVIDDDYIIVTSPFLGNGKFLKMDVAPASRKYYEEHYPGQVENVERAKTRVDKRVEKLEEERRISRPIYPLAHEFCQHFLMKPVFFLGDNHNLNQVSKILYLCPDEGNLKNYLIGKVIDDIQVLKWGHQLISAIEFCHEKWGIVHRAISPVNVFMYRCNDGIVVKLGGLSLARTEAHGMTEGHDKYREFAAPETISDNTAIPIAFYGRSADIWSFGMVMYYMSHEVSTNGEHIFERKLVNRKGLFKEHLLNGNRPQVKANLNDNLRKIITTCWRSERANVQGQSVDLDFRPSATQLCSYLDHHLCRA